MVSIARTELNRLNKNYEIPGMRATQNIQQIIQSNQAIQTVRVDDRNVMSPRIMDALSRIQELSEKGIKASGIISQNINTNMANAQYFRGTLEEADPSRYSGFEGVPSGSFQVFSAPKLSDDQLKDLVRTSAKIGGLVNGSDALYKALEKGTAKIYNQKDAENLLGKPVDWKQGSISGTMWDRNAINQQEVQKITEAGKKIFSGAIGSIHFAVVY